MSTTWEQLEGAALSLVRSGPIKDRLTEAYRNHLSHVRAEDLPEALREDFRACHHALTRERPMCGEDAVRATVRKMSGTEADELACSVVRLFAAIVREYATAAAHSLTAANGVAVNGVSLTGFNGHAAGVRAKNGAPQVIAL